MSKRMLWSRILCVIGLAMMPIAVAAYVLNSTTPPYSSWLLPGMTAFGTVVYIFNGFDPRSPWLLLTGLTLPGSGLVARGAFLGRSHYRRFLYVALVLTVCGLIAGFAIFVITLMNQSELAHPWWAFVTYAYPIGVIMSCVGAVLVIVESFRRPPVPQNTVETASGWGRPFLPGGGSVNKRMLWSRILNIVGLAMIVVGAVSVFRAVLLPALLVLPVIGSGLVALTAFLGRSRYRKFLYAALVLTVCGLIASYGAIVVTLDPSFNLPFPPWWVYVAVAYPIGAIMSLVGAVLVIVESFHKPPAPQDNVEAT